MHINIHRRLTSAAVWAVFFAVFATSVAGAQSPTPATTDTAQTVPSDDDEDASYRDANKSPRDSEYLQRPISSREFDRENWKKTIQGLHYPIKKEQEIKRQPRQGNQNRQAGPFLKGLLGVLLVLFKIIVYVGFGGGILYLLIRFLTGGNIFAVRSRKISHADAPVAFKEIEEDLPGADLDNYIRQALAQKNYILAVRLYHLSIIRELSASGAVEWKKDKTNRAYLQEMRNSGLYEPFRRATRIFEKAWFGGVPFGEADFAAVQPDLQGLLTRARQKM